MVQLYVILKVSFLIVSVWFYFSCKDVKTKEKTGKIKSIDVGIMNVGDKDLKVSHWTLDGKHSFAAGMVKIGDTSTYLFYEYFRGARIAELNYYFSGDSEYTKLFVSVKKILTPDLDGRITIYYQISNKTTDVEIGIYKFVEEEGKTKLKKIKSYIRSPIGKISKRPVPKYT